MAVAVVLGRHHNDRRRCGIMKIPHRPRPRYGYMFKRAMQIDSCISERGWSAEEFFLRVARKYAPRRRVSTVLRDVECFNDASAENVEVPAYVLKYSKRLLAVYKRKLLLQADKAAEGNP